MLSISSLICICIYIQDTVPFPVNPTTLLFHNFPQAVRTIRVGLPLQIMYENSSENVQSTHNAPVIR